MSKLIVIRGNSASGKSAIANQIAREINGKIALVDLDYYRQHMLFPIGECKADVAALSKHNVTYCLDQDYIVIYHSIFFAHDRNKEHLTSLFRHHNGSNYIFDLDVSLEETIKRHSNRPENASFSADQLRDWYQPIESLGFDCEYFIPENSTLEESVAFIRKTAYL